MEMNKNVPISQYASVPIFGRLIACILFSFLYINSSKACECIETTIKEALKNSEIVFRGKVLQIDTLVEFHRINKRDIHNPIAIEVTFQILENFKGDKKDIVKVVQDLGGCGVHFIKNYEFIVYANKTNSLDKYKSPKEFYFTHSCLRTKSLNTNTNYELQELRAIKPKVYPKVNKFPSK